ncbi:MAG: DnaJ domain-containing protein [Spirochaetia bacterium]|nr:DnaJ domain-containing protein [Spirochaetia bacterium]
MKNKDHNINKKLYLDILDLNVDASIVDIKKAYRKKVKKYHPDLHEEKSRLYYQEKMVLINHAYKSLINDPILSKKTNIKKSKDINDDKNLPDLPKDPGYSYYKQAHMYFHKGFYKYYKKKIKPENKLKAAVEILSNFERAYHYYTLVIEKYPDSLWVWDSLLKRKKIEKLTPIYENIKKILILLIENEKEDKKISFPGVSILDSPEKWLNFLQTKVK